jgi:hypothetical protein
LTAPAKAHAVWGRGDPRAPGCIVCGYRTSEGVVVEDAGGKFLYACCDFCREVLELGTLTIELLPTEALSRDYELASAEVDHLRAKLEGARKGGA